jgi:hypothetical protein
MGMTLSVLLALPYPFLCSMTESPVNVVSDRHLGGFEAFPSALKYDKILQGALETTIPALDLLRGLLPLYEGTLPNSALELDPSPRDQGRD